MKSVQISARIDPALKMAIRTCCTSRGIVLNHFIQEALMEHLEELEDVEDLKHILREPTRPLVDVLRELNIESTL